MPSDSDPSKREHRELAEEKCGGGGEGPLLRAANAAAAAGGHGCPEHDQEIGRTAVVAVSKARGMELAGAIDSQCIGEDAGQISGMDEPLEIPVLNDLTMVLGSIAQSRATGVVVDFSEPSAVYDNVKQAAAFGLSSVVYVPKIELETVTELSAFCEKASVGCLVAPTLSIGSVLLQQAAIQASFHYSNVEIVESRPNPSDLPSQDAIQIANNISDLGQIYNREDMDSSSPRPAARGRRSARAQHGSPWSRLQHVDQLLWPRRDVHLTA
uniref:Dihydrodipicolinate reductase N-terminal domain-containing protein n=1 Tax=Zea mays TaxID=4577 RepID=A0A804LCC2_MAIZE